MALIVHRAQRTDLLADGLGEVLRNPQPDPFATEVVAVPTRGVERFLSQQLALVLGAQPGQQDGVCANIEFPAPDDVVDDVVNQATGWDPATDPWRLDRLRWTLVSRLDACLDEAWAAPLRRFLVAEPTPGATRWNGNGRLVALALRLAALFRSVTVERPHVIQAWAAGENVAGTGAAVPPDLAWEPELWRLVRAAVDRPSAAEALPQVEAVLETEPHRVAVPPRLSVFGPTRLPLLHLRVLQALALRRDVHLWVPDPSPARWTGTGQGHPLLRSLGRDSAELADRLRGPATDARRPKTEYLAAPAPQRPGTLLGHLQHDLSSDALPDSPQRAARVLSAADRSIQVHSCHGRQRQVEVLREVLLGLLQGDPTLQPRDILVMCPDVAVFAPLITAGFAVGNDRLHTPAQDLRVRVADRTREQGNPVLAALDSLLTLATGRLTTSALLDFAALEPVALKFRFDEETRDRLEQLVADAGVRWGLDGADRARFGVGTDQNTWRTGVERMLAGAAMSEDGWQSLGAVLPLDDVGDGDIAAVGRLAELVDLVSGWVTRLQKPQSPGIWQQTLADAVADLMAPAEPWQLTAALAALHRSLDPACLVDLPLGDVRVVLTDLLAGRPTRTNFRTGGVTVCSLVPMRSVPHRVVCLLGVDDGVFPRPPVVDGTDLVARTRQPGERDRTSEDRQVLLDAVMAATDTLVVLYTGFDAHTNAELPASVPVLELLDAIDATAVPAAGGPARGHVVTKHPLQPFDARNFTRDALRPGIFSHDPVAFTGARASLSVREPAPPLAPASLALPPLDEVSLSDLSSFLRDPPDFFLQRRLGLRFRKDDDTTDEQVPLELRGLAQWQVGTRVLCGLRDEGVAADTVLAAEHRRGTLPPGQLGNTAAQGIREVATTILDRARPFLAQARHEQPISVELPDGTRVVGSVPDVHGNCAVVVQFGKLRDRQILHGWLQTIALAAARPGSDCAGVLVGQPSGHPARYGAELRVGDHDPLELLGQLVDLMRRGLADPLPLVPRSSHTYTTKRAGVADEQALAEVRRLWWKQSGWGECDATEPSVRAVWGPVDPFDTLISTTPLVDERSWFPDESTRFGALSRRLWEPVVRGFRWLR